MLPNIYDGEVPYAEEEFDEERLSIRRPRVSISRPRIAVNIGRPLQRWPTGGGRGSTAELPAATGLPHLAATSPILPVAQSLPSSGGGGGVLIPFTDYGEITLS
jgi:hypothetical protein